MAEKWGLRYILRMRTRTGVAGVVLAITAALALAGCVQPPAHVIPTSEPSAKPVFASDAAALAAAKKAFTRYLATSDEIAHDGGANIERLAPFDTDAQLSRDSAAFAKMKLAGHHTVGASQFSDVSLERSEVVSGKAHVVAYICMQIGGTQLVDLSGNDVGSGRPLAVPLEVSFVSSEINNETLLIDRSDGWSGTNFCS